MVHIQIAGSAKTEGELTEILLFIYDGTTHSQIWMDLKENDHVFKHTDEYLKIGEVFHGVLRKVSDFNQLETLDGCMSGCYIKLKGDYVILSKEVKE